MFATGCQDAVIAVASEALTATANFIIQLGDSAEVMAMKIVINPMLEVMDKCLKNGDEDLVVEGLDVIQECCGLEQPLINDHLEVIVRFTLTIIHSKDFETAVKQSAGQTLMNIIEFRPKLFAKNNLVGPTLSVLMDMIAKEEASAAGSLFSFTAPDGVLNDEDEDDPEGDVQKLAQILIDYMAIHIPSKYFSDTVLAMISQGMTSADPQFRKAGCAVLGVIAEGCSDKIRENMGSILPPLLASVQDSEYYVRECACFALGQFSEYCQPDILHYNQMVLPVIFQALDDPRPTVQGTSCYVLEYFCENLQPETLRPYLSALMTKLVILLNSEQKTTKEMALSAIAATAVAAEIDFLPFAEAVCNILAQFLFQTEPSMFTLRGRSLECLGHIAIALGQEHFQRYFEMGMQSASEGIKLEDENLKEHGFVFIANSVKVMREKFQHFLPQLVPYLLEVIQESELVKFGSDDEDEEEEDDEEIDEDDDFMGDYRLNVMEGFVNTKKAALTALGAIAEHTNALFVPYLKGSMEVIVTEDIGALFSLHEAIRAESITILQYFLQSACLASNLPTPKPAEIIQLPQEVGELATTIMRVCVTTILGEKEKLPVSYACECIEGVLKFLGVAALHLPNVDSTPVANSLMNAILVLLQEKSPCQMAGKVEHGGDEEEDEDHDNVVIDSVTDLVSSIASVMGAEFVPYFDEFHKQLMKFTKAARSHSDRAMAIGCYAEVFKEIGPNSMKYADAVVPVINAGLSDPMESVRRNSAYCIGILVESTGNSLASKFLEILHALHPLCIRKENQKTSDAGGADVDNAIAAVARMVNSAASSLPLGHVLPVMFNALPLRGDTSEGPSVYGSFLNLLKQNNPDIYSLLPQLLPVLTETLLPTSTSIEDTKSVVCETFRIISTNTSSSQILQQYMMSIGEVEQNAIRNALQ